MICLYLCFLFSSPLQLTHFSLQQSSMAQKSNDIHEIGEKPFERKQTVKTVWNQADKICSCMFPFHLNTHTHTRFPLHLYETSFLGVDFLFFRPRSNHFRPTSYHFYYFFSFKFHPYSHIWNNFWRTPTQTDVTETLG